MKCNEKYIALLVCILLFSIGVAGQRPNSVPIVTFPTVQPPAIPNPGQYPAITNITPQPHISHSPIPEDSQQRNAALIREIEEYESYLHKGQNQRDAEYLINNGFAFQGNNPDAIGIEHYYSAFDTISDMLSGKKPLHLGKALFLIENAYYGGILNYSEFEQALQSKVDICRMVMKDEKVDANDNLGKNMMLFRLITDTLKVKPSGSERTFTNMPVKYDLEDYKSERNYDSHFVTKLMRTNEGQCHSIPLYYLALAEQMGAEAYWAFSPRHSFVRIQDEKGVWYNLELTNGCIMSDAHYMNNSYIKAEALENKIYMEPLDKKQTVAELLNNLAHSYIEKYGFDDFTLYCAEMSKKHADRDLTALMMEAEYYARLTLTIAGLLEARNPEMLRAKSERAYSYYEKMQDLYRQIDDTGYEELPDALYEVWLNYVVKLKEKEKQK